ncbi:hypothetical protein TWF281_007443 [Arthrobotrys megalospora]
MTAPVTIPQSHRRTGSRSKNQDDVPESPTLDLGAGYPSSIPKAGHENTDVDWSHLKDFVKEYPQKGRYAPVYGSSLFWDKAMEQNFASRQSGDGTSQAQNFSSAANRGSTVYSPSRRA